MATSMFRRSTRYIPIESIDINSKHVLANINDIYYAHVYNNRVFFYDHISIALYMKETGNTVTRAQIVNFLQEDGQGRSVSNYLRWVRNNEDNISKYRARLLEIYYAYVDENESFPAVLDYLLPLDMIDELVRKEADQNYHMQLTSLQNRYINSGYAVVFFDEQTVVFIFPHR